MPFFQLPRVLGGAATSRWAAPPSLGRAASDGPNREEQRRTGQKRRDQKGTGQKRQEKNRKETKRKEQKTKKTQRTDKNRTEERRNDDHNENKHTKHTTANDKEQAATDRTPRQEREEIAQWSGQSRERNMHFWNGAVSVATKAKHSVAVSCRGI